MRVSRGNAISIEPPKLFRIHILPHLTPGAGHGATKFNVYLSGFQSYFGPFLSIPLFLSFRVGEYFPCDIVFSSV